MPTIKARVGSQNVVRVLSNASSPPTKLLNLDDVNKTYSDQDGMILVWDVPSQNFIMTSFIDSSSTTIEGIAYFTNTEDSTLPTNGALVVSGGVGISKNLNVGEGLSISGIATFASDVDINAAVDILNNLTVGGNVTADGLYVSGISTFSGITSTISDFYIGNDGYIGGNLKVDGTSEFIGNATFRGGTIGIGDANSDNIDVAGEFISNLVPNADNVWSIGIATQRWKDGLFSGQVDAGDLYVSGVGTFGDGIFYEIADVNLPNGIGYWDNTGKLVSSASTTGFTTISNYILTTDETSGVPIWTSTLDGGTY